MREANEWDSISDWYDAKQGETGDLWHRALIDPTLLRLVGDVADKDVLDLGCGNGYLSRRLAKRGARVTAVDSSARMIANARARDPGNSLGITFLIRSASTLDPSLPDESFDVVMANMTLMDIEDGEGAIREVARTLRKGGRFVASISHPCFDNGSNSAWLTEKVLFSVHTYRRIRAYRTPFAESTPWRLDDDEMTSTLSFHRPLSWYSRALASNGLAITALEEPEPTSEFMEKEDDAPGFVEVPLHLVLEAAKFRSA